MSQKFGWLFVPLSKGNLIPFLLQQKVFKHRENEQGCSNFLLILILEVLWTPGHPHPSHSTQILQEGVEGHRKSFSHKTLSCCGPRQLTLAPKIHSLYPLSSMKWEGSLYKIVLNTISFQLQLQERWKEGLPALRQLPSYEPSAPF